MKHLIPNHQITREFITTLRRVFIWGLIVFTIGFIFGQRLNLRPDNAYTWQSNTANTSKTTNPNTLLIRWDALHYQSIIQDGYSFKSGELSNIAFFPLFPFCIYLLSLLHIPFLAAALIINLLAITISVMTLRRLISKFHPGIIYKDVLTFAATFPVVIFLIAPYTESLFLMTSLLFVYFFKDSKFTLAGLFGFFAALCRFNGILLLLIGIPLMLMQVNRSNKLKALYANCAVLLGPMLFFLYHRLEFGSFTRFFEVQKTWGRQLLKLNTDHFSSISSAGYSNLLFDVAIIVGSVYLCYRIYKHVDKSYAAYSAFCLFLPLLSGTTMSIGRYMLPIFPLWLGFATIKSSSVKQYITFASIVLLTLYSGLYMSGYWAG